jgi:glycosyltransferase involved in cell wall biosynthesis
LALEVKTPLNRNICLTNKIFTYLQSGLAVIASDTMAQKAFMEQYPGIGRIYEGGNIQSLSGVISAFNQNRELHLEARQNALALGREQLNWQQESKKFIQLVEQTLIAD